MDVVISNGTIVTAADTFQADLAIRSGRIVLIGQDLVRQPDLIGQARIFDATGRFVLPGAIDAHVHLQLPVGQLVSADDCATGTRAAACGGVTTILDFATPRPGQTLPAAIRERQAQFDPMTWIDYGLHGVIQDTGPELADQMQQAVALGVASFKIYLVYAGLRVDDGGLAEALALARTSGALICVHAENADLITRRTARLLASGQRTAWHHYESRPEFVEAEAVMRVIHLAKAMDAPVYIVHLACAEGLAAVSQARAAGQPVYAETCPHYLHFTNAVYQRPDGQRFVCSPPMKGPASRQALWNGLARGDIVTVATDHCPFQAAEKDRGREDFPAIPNGCMGVETLYPYMLNAARQGLISINRAVDLCSTRVARLFGCAPQKGTLAVGSDADLVIYDPRGEWVVTPGAMHSAVDYTIWEGLRLAGRIESVFSRGRLVCHEGRLLGQPGQGQYVFCQASPPVQ